MFQHCLTRKCFCWMHADTAFLAMLSGNSSETAVLGAAGWWWVLVLERSRNACTQCWNAVGSLYAFLLYSGTVRVHFYYVQSLSVCISIIFRLCSSTGYVHFYSVRALFSCISTVFQHWLRAFPLFLRAFSACISIVLDCSGMFLDS